jgi:hypothetical protein
MNDFQVIALVVYSIAIYGIAYTRGVMQGKQLEREGRS